MTVRGLMGLLASVFGARLLGAAAGLLVQVLLARTLPAAEVGAYFVMISTAAFSALVLSLGYPDLGITLLARYHSLGRAGMARRYLLAARRDIALAGAVLLLPAMVAVWYLPLDPVMRIGVFAGLVACPASMMIRFNSTVANALKRFTVSFAPDFLLKSFGLLLVLGLWFAVSGGLSLAVVIVAFLVMNLITAMVQAAVLGEGGLPVNGWGEPVRNVWRLRALPLVVVAFVTFAFADVTILVASAFLPAHEMAVFGIAIRLAAIAGFVSQAAQQFVIRDMTAALVAGDAAANHRLLLRTNLTMLALMGSAILGAVLFGDKVLLIFGKDHVGGQPLLVMFLIAQAIRAASGMNIHLLSLGGYQARLARSCVAILVAMVAMAALLAPRFGGEGVAAAMIMAELGFAVVYSGMAGRLTGRRGDLAAALTQWLKNRPQISRA